MHLIAIVFISIMFCVCLYSDFKRKKSNPNFPTLLITIGICFTFLGISIGLTQFNIANITESLPHLIDGIKTAFWGSLTGIIAAIFLKLISIFYFKEEDSIEIEIQKFYQEHSLLLQSQYTHHNVFIEMKQNLELQSQNFNLILQYLQIITQNNPIQQIQNTLNGLSHIVKNNADNQNKYNQQLNDTLTYSLNNLVKNQIDNRNESFLKLDDLRSDLQIFLDKQIQNNTYIFTTALEKSMQKFNDDLMQHLGNNFKNLDQAIQKLVIWQDNHIEQLEYQDQAQQNLMHYFSNIQEDFQKMLIHSENFAKIISDVNQMFDQIQNQQSHVEQKMQYFYQTLDEKFIDIEKSKKMIESSFKASTTLLENFKTEMTYIYQDSRDYIHSNQKQNLEYMSNMNEELLNNQKTMGQSFEKTYQNLNRDLGILQQKHEIALNESLLSLARQLGSISEKFAYDYEPITQNLKYVMQMLNEGIKPSKTTEKEIAPLPNEILLK